jgi:NAD(P)-dependent dehydrogenase (short-subunit alcohol dehydrogenase family)
VQGRGAVLDAGDAGSIEALVGDLEAAEGLPTILVNNAAITRDMLLLRMKSEDWDQVIATNLTGVFRISKACLRRMLKERRGRIINVHRSSAPPEIRARRTMRRPRPDSWALPSRSRAKWPRAASP